VWSNNDKRTSIRDVWGLVVGDKFLDFVNAISDGYMVRPGAER